MKELLKIGKKRTKRVVGLMSGTSFDGISAAVVQITGCGTETRVLVMEHATFPYDREVKRALLRVSTPESSSVDVISELNFVIGELFAEAARKITERAGLQPSDIDVIGSHGQTIYHCPLGEHTAWGAPSTLQIGEPCVIAERMSVTTVADFRTRDIAAGGVGAPLVPYADFVLFRSDEKSRLLLNIGGIANVTVLPRACSAEQVSAFDTGPGNMVIDAVVRETSRGQEEFDRNGRLAAGGTPHEELLKELLGHEFFQTEPPKSTGRELFGGKFVMLVLERARALGLSDADLVATATALTPRSVADACERFVFPRVSIDELIISGGGSKNETLVQGLRECFEPVPVVYSDDYGISSSA
ncbi:MAG: anhydro-N-acetylmuramic acid kinase, partial [Candidatus Eiseniibacteriota bacterium]